MLDSIAHSVDLLLALLTKAQWDAWRGWLTTAGGLIALFVGVRTYRRNVKLKREEQARLVYATLLAKVDYAVDDFLKLDRFERLQKHIEVATYEDYDVNSLGPSIRTSEAAVQVTLVVNNHSKELVGRANVQVVDLISGKILPFRGILEAIPPEGERRIRVTIKAANVIDSSRLGATVAFSDASGQWWRRHLTEPVRPIHSDPGNIQEMTENDKLSVSVKGRRLLRAVRGITPIP